jgi:hypothetical protein
MNRSAVNLLNALIRQYKLKPSVVANAFDDIIDSTGASLGWLRDLVINNEVFVSFDIPPSGPQPAKDDPRAYKQINLPVEEWELIETLVSLGLKTMEEDINETEFVSDVHFKAAANATSKFMIARNNFVDQFKK